MATTYGKSGLTGGATTDLDGIDGANLVEGDRCIVITSDPYAYIYRLNATSGAAESSPDTISPDNNAGQKRWLLVNILGAGGVAFLKNVLEDTTPQLGGDLDTNAHNIGIDDTKAITDESGNEQIKFSTTASAVNEITIKNAATGAGPQIQATGGDTNIDLLLVPKGTGSVNLADALLQRPKIKDYGESVNAIGSIGGGAQAIDLELGNVVTGTVDTSETTFTFTNPPASGVAGSFTLILTNGGSQTVNWPAAVDWAGGTAPALTASGRDVLTFTTVDAGTIWYGFAAGLAMA